MSSNPTFSAIDSRLSALESLARSQASRLTSVEGQLAAIHGGTVPVTPPSQAPAPGGTIPPGYSSATPDNVGKVPRPDDNANRAMIAAVNQRLDAVFPAGKAPTSQYPSAAKLVDAFVYQGATVDKFDAYYRSCFNTGAYGPMGSITQNGTAREKAFTVGHDNLTDKLISYCSYVKAPLPTRDQLV